MKKIKRLVFLIALVVLVLTLAGSAYGYFDVLGVKSDTGLVIGEWNKSVGAMQYLNVRDPEMNDSLGNTVSYLKYVADIIWSDAVYNGNGDIVSGTARSQYSDYSNTELKALIDTVITYSENFLTVDGNDNMVFPNRDSVTEIETHINTMLSPGESLQIPSVLLAAELYDEIHWAPVTYSISIESASGEDISDYSIELLYASEYAGRFGYQYLVRDYTSYDINRDTGGVDKKHNKINAVTTEIFTDIQAYKFNGSAYNLINYRHYVDLPQYGEWSRFVKGADLFLDKPSGSPIGTQQQIKSNGTKPGLSVIGKANGTASELRIGLYDRGNNGDLIKSIPLIINLSRGVMLDVNGNPLSYSAAETQPIIKIRLVAGDVWGS